jgi:hypothetical protein
MEGQPAIVAKEEREFLTEFDQHLFNEGTHFGGGATAPFSFLDYPHMLTITLPPLAGLVFKHEA